MSIENKKGASRNNSSINLPKSQTSTKEETPRKEVSSQDNDIEINGSSSSSLSHISEMLSKKKLNYSQICNKVPYHNANKDNFVFEIKAVCDIIILNGNYIPDACLIRLNRRYMFS